VELLNEKMVKQLLAERKKLYTELERFSGMPTLEYDEIVEDLVNKITEIEEQLTTTCSVCGGEKLLYGAGSDEIQGMSGLYNPRNGLCSCFEKSDEKIRYLTNPTCAGKNCIARVSNEGNYCDKPQCQNEKSSKSAFNRTWKNM
jgi:hypothetical protein